MDLDAIAMALGKATKAVEMHEEVLGTIFEKLDGIKTAVDQNIVHAENRDAKLAELKEDVAEIDRKIENGLRSEVMATKAELVKMQACLERRKREKALEDERGVYGFFRRGFAQFKERGSYIVVTSLLVGGTFLIIWIAAKILVFHEGMFPPILRIFKII